MSADGVDAAGDSSSDWEDEPLRAKRSRALAAADEQSSDSDLSDGSDAEEDDGFGEEPSRTDDEQDEKLIEAVPFERGDEAREDVNALKAVVIQDMKTEDSSVPGGYALPCVTRGSVVLVRGADDAGATVTWVAEVRKIYRAGGSKLKADIRWFYRRSDVPEKAARRLVLVDEARELVYTNDEHTVDVRFIRHPAQAWFLSAGDAAPRMRCSEGGTRHTRHRPGFLIRYAYDAGSKKLHAIGSKALLEKSPELAREVGLRVKRSREELARLEADEAARDAAAGLSGVEAPPRAPPAGGDDDEEEEQEEEEEEVEEQEGHEGTSSDDDEPILGRPGQAGAAAAAAGNGVAGAAVAAEGGAAPTAAHQRQQREQEAAGEARRQEAAVQRAEEQQRRQEDQRRRQQQELDDDAVHLAQLLPQAAGPAAASSANSQQQQQQQQQSPPSAAAGGWRRCVQKLMRSGGELPKRAAPEAPPKGGRPQPGSQLSEDAVAAKVAAALRPGLPHMAAALRAVCAATEAAMRELDCLNILRLLYVWLWHLADELHAGGRAPELVECAELALRALKRCACWSAAHLAWLRMVHGSNLLNMLAAEEAAEQFTPGVQRAARDLKAAWSAQLEQKRGEAAARRARQQGEAKRDRQEQRLLLQQSPQAAKGQSLALSGRRLSALGAGGATYVRPKLSPSPASARHVSAAAAAAAAGARGLALDARMAGAAGGSQPAAARGSQPGAAAGGGAKQPARPAQQQQQRAPQQQQRAPQQQQQQRQQQQQPRPQQQPHKPPPQQQQQQQGDVLSQMWRTAFADRAQATVAAGAAAGQRPVAPGAAADRGGPADARRSATTPHQQQAAAAGGVPPDVRRSVAAAESRSASTGALAGRKRPAPAAAPPAAAEPPAAAAAAAEGNERAAKVPRLGPNPVHPLAGKGEERRRVASSKLQAMLRASKKG